MMSSKINQVVSLFTLCVLVSISGCSEYIHERNASTIDVVPVNYHLQLKVHSPGLKKSVDKVVAYVNSHRNELVDHKIELNWYSKNAYKVATQVKSYLVSQGFNTDSVVLTKGNAKRDKPYFDLELFAQRYQSVSSICHYEQIEEYGRYPNGCFVEGNRWQMMNHPERVLNTVNSTSSEQE
ncbi:hypothetical protein [Vibrio neonatus]|uniref:hypothetical protein n=1 Tax=Vibrio neonatus TaxID=278860 RepID=UPI0021C48C91|nr:hypothetical protein [Vibrio neonatus]